ncbi:hypothetical protein [Providencia phage Kokobel2]|nr:hypothetical protein [Providencia phage Kokobel2]
MSETVEGFKILREQLRAEKRNRAEVNRRFIEASGLPHKVDSSGSVIFTVQGGKLMYYPSTNKYQFKGKVGVTTPENIIALAKSMGVYNG